MKKLVPAVLIAVGLFFVGCSSQAVDDSTVTAKVKTKLATDTQTSAIKIGVDTTGGVVTLSGTVPTDTVKNKAEQLAKNTDGVKRVVNKISVDPNSLGATNFGDKAGQAAKDVGGAISDEAILATLKAKLIADGITGTNVDVSGGKVVLKGEVENPQKKAKAEDLARKTNGVRDVRNQLTVKNRSSS
jgi:hyperosmotically inducible periplasmic protein